MVNAMPERLHISMFCPMVLLCTAGDAVFSVLRRQFPHALAIGLGVTLLLGGCSLMAPSPQAERGRSKLELHVQASDGLNPNGEGRPAPILLRIYELRGPDVFKEVDFFALNDSDRATLGSELIGMDRVVLRPGERHIISRKANPETRVIGVFAGYRDLRRATWRAVHVLPQASKASWYGDLFSDPSIELRIDLQPNAVLITDKHHSGPKDPAAGAAKSERASAPPANAPQSTPIACIRTPAEVDRVCEG